MKFFLIILLSFFTTSALAQTVVSGEVLDIDSKPLQGVSVVATRLNSNSIIAFSITDASGRYLINLNIVDELFVLKFTAIGFGTLTLTAKSGTQRSVIMMPVVSSLPTVIVKTTPIQEQGDTLNYNTKAFTGKQDRLIGDVLKNLPGVEVSENGQVSFNGQAISHYYIDGLDMLGNQYNIANRSIPADLVARVQILQRHQDVKMLEGVKKGEQPALNLILKSNAKNKFIGKANIGVGAAPFLFDNDVTGLNFRKDFQLLTAYKQNNVGNLLIAEVEELVTVSRLGENIIPEASNTAIPNFNFNTPPIRTIRYQFNNSNLLYFNTLKRLNETSQLVANFSYGNDHSTYNSTTAYNYIFPNAADVLFNENIDASVNTNIGRMKISYEKNDKKTFIKNIVSAKISTINYISLINNNANFLQKLRSPFYEVTNNYTQMLSSKKRFVTLHSLTSFTKEPQVLTVFPGVFTALVNDNISYNALLQNATAQNFKTSNTLSFLQPVRKNNVQLDINLAYKNQLLETGLRVVETNGYKILADSFANNLRWEHLKLSLSAQTILKWKRSDIIIKLPISFNLIAADNHFEASKRRNAFFLNPYIGYRISLSKKYDLDIMYNHNNSVGSYLQLADGYILSDYRLINKRESPIAIASLTSVTTMLSFQQPTRALFWSISLSASQMKNEVISGQNFDQFAITNLALPIVNRENNFRLSTSINKYLIYQKINLRLQTGLDFNETPFLLEDKLVTSRSTRPSANLEIKVRKWKKWEFASTTNYFRNASNQENEAKMEQTFSSVNFNQILGLFYSLSKKTDLTVSGDYYNLAYSGGEKVSNYFLNVGLVTKFKNCSIAIDWTNITNVKFYNAATNFRNLQKIINYRVRPANLLAKIYFSF